jgi:pimeloyl-ACP methyl ester carboxylesterase
MDRLPRPASQLPAPVVIDSPDGTPIATYDLGGSGTDVLFVHATGFHAGVWTPLIDHLESVRPALLDVRGHGRSGVPDAGMDWHGTAEDVLATVDALGLERPFGVGHSMGGASLLLAELARPGTFRGLWIFEPIVIPPDLVDARDGGENPLSAGARRRRDRFSSFEEAFTNYASKPPFAALAPEALGAYVVDGLRDDGDGVTLRCRPEVEAATYEMGGRHSAWGRLGELRCPVVVARGSDAVPGPAGFAPRVAERIPGSVLEDHPRLGHFGPLEDPEGIAAHVRAAVAATVTPAS